MLKLVSHEYTWTPILTNIWVIFVKAKCKEYIKLYFFENKLPNSPQLHFSGVTPPYASDYFGLDHFLVRVQDVGLSHINTI